METIKIRTILLLCLSLILIDCSNKANRNSYVMDDEQLLTGQQKDSLIALYASHEKKTSNQIALVTTADYGDEPNIHVYATNLANELGVGQADKDNGILIVLSKANKETRISTGYGMSGVLKDSIVDKIIDSLMVPEFKKGNVYKGIYTGSKAITDFLEQPGNEIK